MGHRNVRLQSYSGDQLQAVADTYELQVEDRRVNEFLVDAMVPSKKVRIGDVLAQLPRDRLKDLCVGLDLDNTGREKAVLIARILGEQLAETEEPTDAEPAVSAAPELKKLLGQQLSNVSLNDGWPMLRT